MTAQRRSENVQNVPISIQALTAETLTQLHVETFDDYVKYLPNVTSKSNGPGQRLHLHARPELRAAGGQSGQRLHRRLPERRDLPG